ncbi:MAG TPA: hypothetical protein PLV06_11530 [Bacteroidales bacterium]|nr:hypothetical protein [Bacteroidales bacterium]
MKNRTIHSIRFNGWLIVKDYFKQAPGDPIMKKIILFLIIFSLGIETVISQQFAIDSEKTLQDVYSPSLFCNVVIYRTPLGLPESIVDTINERAATAIILQMNDPEFNLREYERGVVRELLTEHQFTDLLVFRNQPVARELTAKIWNEMLKQHLVFGSDSVRLYGTINGHLLTSLVTREYFYDNLNERNRQLAELDRRAPSALYKYFHHGYERPVAANPYRAEFIW